MRKILSVALLAATLTGTVGMATTAGAQEWGPPPLPPAYGPGLNGWAPPPPAWEHGPGAWGGPEHVDYRQQRRYWEWRHYREMRHREYCRWHQCW